MKLPSFSQRIYYLIGSLLSSLMISGQVFGYEAVNSARLEDLHLLGNEVLSFARSSYAAEPSNTRIELKLAGLDSRLRLPQCSRAHELMLQDNLGAGGTVNVAVNCRGDVTWAILVPIQATIFRRVPVANRTLTVGQAVTEEDLTQEERELTNMRVGYFLKADDLVGKQVRYAINKGDCIRSSWVEAPLVIKRGDEVSLEAQAGAIRVITKGTAITDGRLGQQIRIKNTQSDKIVNALVMAPGVARTVN